MKASMILRRLVMCLLLGLALGEVAFHLLAAHRAGPAGRAPRAACGWLRRPCPRSCQSSVAVMVDDLQVLILGDAPASSAGWSGRDRGQCSCRSRAPSRDHSWLMSRRVPMRLEGMRLEEPDVGDGSGELDVAHAFAAHLGGDDLDAALFADDAAGASCACTCRSCTRSPSRGRRCVGAEETVAFRLEGAVVDGFGLFDFAVRPFADDLRRGNGYPDGLQVAHVGDVARSSAVSRKIVHAHDICIPCLEGWLPVFVRSPWPIRLPGRARRCSGQCRRCVRE